MIVKKTQKSITPLFVKFSLTPDKQRKLIRILQKNTTLTATELSELLNISEEKLIAVLAKKDFLTKSEAKKLAQYFCLLCTD